MGCVTVNLILAVLKDPLSSLLIFVLGLAHLNGIDLDAEELRAGGALA